MATTPVNVSGWTVLMATLALASTGAILTDLNASIPRVAHSLPFKMLGLYAILYGTTKSWAMALRGVLLFLVFIFILVSVEFIIAPADDNVDLLDRWEHVVA